MKRILYGLLLFILCNFSFARTMNLFIADNYLANSTVQRFEAACHCTLNISYFSGNENMMAKIIAGQTGYDVIVATGYAIETLNKAGKLSPLDLSRLPNLKYIAKPYLNRAYDPTNAYSVPYAYTPVLIGYNKAVIQQLKLDPTSWAILFDPKILRKIANKVTVFDESRNVFAAALLYLGKDPNSGNPADLEKAYAVIQNAKPFWRKFDTDAYYKSLQDGEIFVAMSYSDDLYLSLKDAHEFHLPLQMGGSLQKEGNMMELDNCVIPTASVNKDLAYLFINTVLDPQSAYELATMTGASIPNTMALQTLKQTNPLLANTDWIYPKKMNKLYNFVAYPPKIRRYLDGLWTKIKS